jgi:hypothetical protein
LETVNTAGANTLAGKVSVQISESCRKTMPKNQPIFVLDEEDAISRCGVATVLYLKPPRFE